MRQVLRSGGRLLEQAEVPVHRPFPLLKVQNLSCNVQIRQLVMLTYLVDALMNVYSSLCPGSTKRSHLAWRRLWSQRDGSCVSGPQTLMRRRRAFGGTGNPFGLFVVLVCSVHVSKGLIRNSVSTLLLSGQVLWQGNRIRTLAPRSTL